jgi:hypothetical protein
MYVYSFLKHSIEIVLFNNRRKSFLIRNQLIFAFKINAT